MTPPSPLTKVETLSFEESLKELEGIVSRFEAGGLTLDQAVVAYERGMSLKKRCAELLDSARLRIETVGKGAEG
jgi:exodeoxyribonuclease VII small subunit